MSSKRRLFSLSSMSWLRLAWPLVGMLLAAGCFGTDEKARKQAEIQYDLGVNDLHEGRMPEALDSFQQAVGLDPDFAEAHNGLGLALHFLGKNDQALEHLKKALELRPTFSEVRANLGRVYISLGRFREAIPVLQQALDDVFLRERYLAESNLGWALFQVGQEDVGLRHVMNALAQNDKYCVGYEYLGLMYKKQRRYAEALEELGHLLERCPDYGPGHLEKARVHLMHGQVEQGCHHLSVCRDMGRMTTLGRECTRLHKANCPQKPAPEP